MSEDPQDEGSPEWGQLCVLCVAMVWSCDEHSSPCHCMCYVQGCAGKRLTTGLSRGQKVP